MAIEVNIADASVSLLLDNLFAEVNELKYTLTTDRDKAVHHLQNIQEVTAQLSKRWGH